MLKLRVAFGLALFVGALTLINSISNDARMGTVIYRVAISFTVFGVAGYGIGVVFEKFLERIVTQKKIQGQHLDVVSEPENLDDQGIESTFSPFTSDNFQQISRPKE